MKRFSLMVLACVCSMAQIGVAAAQDDSGRVILQQAADYASSLTAFTVDFELLFDAKVDAESEHFVTDYTVGLRHPGEAMVHMNNRFMEAWFYTTGTETTRYLPEVEQYQVEARGMQSAELIRGASNNVILPAIAVFAELTQRKPLSDVLGGDKPIVLLGEETVNGIVCNRIRFQYADFPCEVWIGKGSEPLVHRILPDMTEVKEAFTQQGHTVGAYLIQLDVLHWQPNSVEDSLLTFTPKDGVEKVAQFYREQPEPAAAELIGKAAPVVDLKLMSGEAFDLTSKKGSEIVVLDFWATWCGPCRMGMPILSKVVKEFEEKGVRLYAVNLQEGPEQVQGFLESTGLDVTVVMDPEGKMGAAYFADAIPLMVIVGRDGLVKKVHNGVTPTYEEDIRAELTALTQ